MVDSANLDQGLGTRLSIVTITMNSEKYVEQTIKGVIGQTYPNIEYIIIDGGSSDGTVDIIQKYEKHIDHWVSEPDAGIADAMNKGIARATGDFIYFLNSDDYLEGENAIQEASQYLSRDADIFLFGIYLEKGADKTLRKPGKFGPWTNFKLGFSHQSAICATSLFRKIGLFDTDFHVAMDYDFFLRAYRQGINAVSFDAPIATMRLIGVSSQGDWRSLRERFGEEYKLHRKNCDSYSMRIVYAVYWLLYLPYRRLRHLVSGAS